MSLKISESLRFPKEAVTQTFGILSVRGAGKSNCAAVMAEEMFSARLPFVAVDPVGAWFGLRSSADGKDLGLSVPIFGGRHGDVPVERGAGQLIADLVVDERLSCVLDVSEFSEGDKIRFLTDFAERLYRRNENPLHLFLEEADDYIPQRPFREQARCLRAWENIVRRGRSRGLGITMISQRSAAINKNVLTQIETLIVLRTTSPQDRKAIEAWVEYHGQSRELLESLPGLKDGEAWVWSPHWLHALKRVQVRRRNTFDSGATPKEIHGKRPPATMADVDLPAVRERMAATIERAKAEDPRELRRQVAELRAELSRAQKAQPAASEPKIIEVSILKDSQIDRLEKAVDCMDKIRDRLTQAQQVVVTEIGLLREAVARVSKSGSPPTRIQPIPSPLRHKSKTEQNQGFNPVEGISSSQQRILDALAWLESVGIASASKAQVALLANQSPTSGGYFNNLGKLRSAGLIEYPSPSVVALMESGRSSSRQSDIPTTSEELHGQLFRRLSSSQAEILRHVIHAYPKPLVKSELAEKAGQSPTSGGYFNNLGRLRSLGLIDYPQPGMVVAKSVLFLEGNNGR